MHDQQTATSQERAAPDGYSSWPDYWKALGMPWRTEPEIDEERQRFLTERRATTPNMEQGTYPFGGFRLTRADIGWLLATHESGGVRGPVDWRDSDQRTREGLDLRGADLRELNLSNLPLAGLRGGLDSENWGQLTTVQRDAVRIHLERTNLSQAHVEGAILTGARMEGAALFDAHLEQVVIGSAHLEQALLHRANLAGARIIGTYLDTATNTSHVTLNSKEYGPAFIADVRWGGTNLTALNWPQLHLIGQERMARNSRTMTGKRKDRVTRRNEFEKAVRAYRQLTAVLRDQGMNEVADRFAYRAQMLQRQVLRRQRQFGRALGSLLLDIISGYGYRPLRSFITYLLVVLAFAACYFALGGANSQSLSWNEALVISMTAFHGRGFFPMVFQAADPQAAVAAVEALFGLLIEITFIATFTQRFFAR
jgi:uncharacterized protein YjbI with pentapeptide repeats